MIKFPDKYNICPKFTGELLPEPNSRDKQYQYGYNKAIDLCVQAEKNGRMSMNKILKMIINHMEWNQSGAPLSNDDWLCIAQNVVNGEIRSMSRIRINQIELAQAIHTALYGGSKPAERKEEREPNDRI